MAGHSHLLLQHRRSPDVPGLLLLFSAVNLIIGTSAFVISGILAPVAEGLGVGVPAVGQAMTAYALAMALLPPLMLARTAAWPRRRLMVSTLLLLALGSALCTFATGLQWLLAGRVLMGAGSAFSPAAAGVAVSLVPPQRRGQALALVFLGIGASYAVGVPVGTWVGHTWGWRVTFGLGTAALLVAAAAIAIAVPRNLVAGTGSLRGLGRALRRRDVSSVLGFTLLYFTGIFIPFTYVGPMLRELVPLTATQMALTLAVFGAASVAGTMVGGVASDHYGPWRTLLGLLLVFGTSMAVLPLARGHWDGVTVAFSVWGAASFGMMAAQQTRLTSLSPLDAPLLISINSSMMYLGMALGAVVGGAAAAQIGYGRLTWAGLAAVALAFLLLCAGPASARVGRQRAPEPFDPRSG